METNADVWRRQFGMMRRPSELDQRDNERPWGQTWWYAGAVVLALWLLWWAILSVAPFWGEYPTDGELRKAAIPAFVSGLLLSSGPVRKWRRTGRVVWLIAGLVVLVLCWGMAGSYLIESLTPDPNFEPFGFFD